MTKDDYEIWYEALSLEEKAEILEAFTSLTLKVPGAKFKTFLRLCYRVKENMEKKKFKRAFNSAEKIGKAIIKGKK